MGALFAPLFDRGGRTLGIMRSPVLITAAAVVVAVVIESCCSSSFANARSWSSRRAFAAIRWPGAVADVLVARGVRLILSSAFVCKAVCGSG